MQLEERSEIVRRLRVSEDHLHAIIGMVEASQPPGQVLHQLRAVRISLRAACGCLLTYQVELSQEIILHSLRAEERTAELATLVELFATLTYFSEIHADSPFE